MSTAKKPSSRKPTAKKTGSRRHGSWTTHELARLKELWTHSSEERVAKVLGRSLESVRRRAHALFPGRIRRARWTAREDRSLRLGYGGSSLEALARVLGRSLHDVQARIEKLRAAQRKGRITRSDEAMLKRVYGTRSQEALEVALARPRAVIERLARELCLGRDKRSHPDTVRMPRWTDAQVKALVRLYPTQDNLAIARALLRSVQSVANKAWQLGLEKNSETLAKMGRRNVARRWTGRR